MALHAFTLYPCGAPVVSPDTRLLLKDVPYLCKGCGDEVESQLMPARANSNQRESVTLHHVILGHLGVFEVGRTLTGVQVYTSDSWSNAGGRAVGKELSAQRTL